MTGKSSTMSDPIPDKAEVSIDFPDKFYMGSFGRESRFDVSADLDGVHIHLDRSGDEKRRVGFHLHYDMVAGILRAVGDALKNVDGLDATHIANLREAIAHLGDSVPPPRS